MKNLVKYFKSVNGQSLAEFAVTTAMMATLATTAAPKFSGVGEGAKEKKTLADIDKILKSANNFTTNRLPNQVVVVFQDSGSTTSQFLHPMGTPTQMIRLMLNILSSLLCRVLLVMMVLSLHLLLYQF